MADLTEKDRISGSVLSHISDAQNESLKTATSEAAMRHHNREPTQEKYESPNRTVGVDLEKGFIPKSNTTKAVNQNESPREVSSPSSLTESKSPNLVHWDGDQDPENPQNWLRSKKWAAIMIVSSYTFMSPIASSILAPSLQKIGEDLNIQSDTEKSLCLSIFVLGFAFGPMVLAPLSELYGRAIILHISNVFFGIFNCACGFAQSKEQLIVFRLLGGLGGSAPLALGPGILGDLFTADERGLAVSIYSFFPILGPAIGPICGGFITEYSSWRWAFWATSIVDVPVLLLGVKYLKETYALVLLSWKKQKLIKETGNEDLFTRYEKPGRSHASEMGVAMLRPLKLICTQPIIIAMGLGQAYLYGLMYVVLTTFPKLWRETYDQSVSIGGLNYISLGIGYCIGIQVSSHTQDHIYRILKRRNNNIGLPEFRVPGMLPVAILLPLGFFLYGWSAEKHMHWIVPNIGAAIFATGIMIGYNALITYVLDSYQTYSASAAAATAVLRSVAAFLLPLGAPAMYQKLGFGWGNSLLGFLAIIIGGPAPVLLWVYGAKIRARSTFASG